MRWHKFISVILHPIVMPTVGALLYFMLSPINIGKQQQYALLSVVFIATYVIPLLLLIFLKAIKYIKDFQVKTIEERKLPVFFMISLFFILGKTFFSSPSIRNISYLFYGTALALCIVYLFFFTKTKISLHLLSMGSAIGYFLIFQYLYNISTLPVIIIFVLLSGLLASARLYLKAHTAKEVYLGFFTGFICQFITFIFLQ